MQCTKGITWIFFPLKWARMDKFYRVCCIDTQIRYFGVSWLVEWKFGIYETINVTNFSLIITLQHFLKRIHVNSSSIILLFFLFQTPSSLWAVRNKTVRVYECIVEELKMSPRVFEPLKMTSIDNDKVCRIMCWT